MGKKSQTNGAQFEGFFEASCNRQGFAWIKIPTGARIYGSDRFGRPRYTLIKAPFDYAIGGVLNGLNVAAYIDTKSIGQKSFPASLIDENQVENLLPFEEKGFPAGYVIYFRPLQQIIFIPASFLLVADKAITPDDGLLLGDLFDFKLSKLWD